MRSSKPSQPTSVRSSNEPRNNDMTKDSTQLSSARFAHVNVNTATLSQQCFTNHPATTIFFFEKSSVQCADLMEHFLQVHWRSSPRSNGVTKEDKVLQRTIIEHDYRKEGHHGTIKGSSTQWHRHENKRQNPIKGQKHRSPTQKRTPYTTRDWWSITTGMHNQIHGFSFLP